MKKHLLALLTMIFALCLISTSVFAAEAPVFSDMPEKDYWSYNALTNAVDNDLLKGYEGKLLPKDSLTRAEMASILVRAYGGTEEADISAYTDVSPKDWFYKDMGIAVQMKLFMGNGNGTLSPNAYITRQEAACVIARALSLTNGDTKILDKYKDKEKIASWAVGYFASLVNASYFNGYDDDTIRPNNCISREEFAKLMDNTYKQYINKGATISSVVKGNIVVKTKDVTMKNLKVNGDLIIGEGLGNNGITLDGVDVTGRIIFRGGNENIVLNKTTAKSMIAAKTFKEPLKLDNSNSPNLKNLTIFNDVDGVYLTGTFDEINIAETANPIKINVSKNSVIDKITLRANDQATIGGTVNKIYVRGPIGNSAVGAGLSATPKALINLESTANVKEIIVADNEYLDIIAASKLMDVNIKATNFEKISVKTTTGEVIPLLNGRFIDSVYDVKVEQTKQNYTNTTIKISGYNEAVVDANKLLVTAKMYYGTEVTQEVSKTFDLKRSGVADLDKSVWTASMDFLNFGKYEVTTQLLNGDKVLKSTVSTVGIVADKYNLAPLNATLPVTYFTLSLWDITKSETGAPVPTIMFLERTNAYDWDKLPENVYHLPTAKVEQGFHDKAARMVSYVKDLYEMNPDAFFNFYCVDNYPHYILTMLVANGIPENQYHATLLTDGCGSYLIFNDTYNCENPQEKYDDMAANWKSIKANVRKTGTFDTSSVKYTNPNAPEVMERYAYAIANESNNVDWLLPRTSGTLNIPNAEFLTKVKASPCIKVVGLNNLLTSLSAKGEATTKEFKALYHFSDTMFSKAAEQNKKVMMILGTKVNGEANFEEYAKFTMDYYGDDYIYYYKGHPGTPTGLYPEKQAQLDKLGITDVESSIAAELILFFYPDIYLCGYQTSVYINVQSTEMACGLFQTTKANADKTYKDLMDFFISPVASDNATYGKLCPDGKTCFLIEFADTTKYDIGIWNSTDSVISYYKITDGNFVPVKK
ncbi:MAG: S-layer homology domain-containing protein [Clostridiales bacterium]